MELNIVHLASRSSLYGATPHCGEKLFPGLYPPPGYCCVAPGGGHALRRLRCVRNDVSGTAGKLRHGASGAKG